MIVLAMLAGGSPLLAETCEDCVSELFSDLDSADFPWVYHRDLGWLYVHGEAEAQGFRIFYLPEWGWTYASAAFPTHYYMYMEDTWLYHAYAGSTLQWMWRYDRDEWITLPAAYTIDPDPQIESLWEGLPPGGKINRSYVESITYSDTDPPEPEFISRVSDPEIALFSPSPWRRGRPAMLICPGGGYGSLTYAWEGSDAAKWLNRRGIVGIVLKYRLPNDSIMEDKSIGPLQDAQRAMRLIRRHGAEWGIDPDRVGIMGFSAGGHLAALASTRYDEMFYSDSDSWISARPDATALVYPVVTMKSRIGHLGSRERLLGQSPSEAEILAFSAEMQVTEDTPPAFLVHSTADTIVLPVNSELYDEALREAGVGSDLHLYPNGGHAFGLGVKEGAPLEWLDAFQSWLIDQGWL